MHKKSQYSMSVSCETNVNNYIILIKTVNLVHSNQMDWKIVTTSLVFESKCVLSGRARRSVTAERKEGSSTMSEKVFQAV